MQNERERYSPFLGQIDSLRVWTSAMTLVLVLVTKSLWLPSSNLSFPQIPFLEGLCQVPLVVDWLLTGCLCLGLAACCIPCPAFKSPNRNWPWKWPWPRIGIWMVLVSGVALVALNQHRFQPWFYQLLLFATFFLLAKSTEVPNGPFAEQRQVFWLQAMVVSIYFHSAVGKFDFEFLHTVGQQFVQVALRLVNLDVDRWQWSARLWFAGLLPLTELLLAVLLAFSMRRGIVLKRVAAAFACIFHLGLMVILGLGLGHSSSVVLWNLQFAVQALLLFGRMPIPSKVDLKHEVAPSVSHDAGNSRWHSTLVGGFAISVMALPLLERWGYWDHWPSWALYAPHSSRVEMYVASSAIPRLPPELQALMRQETQGEAEVLWRRVPLAKWSLASLETPIYPQARFGLGVSRFLAERVQSKFSVKVVVLETAARLSGQRSSMEFVGSERIEQAAERFFWNTRPRF